MVGLQKEPTKDDSPNFGNTNDDDSPFFSLFKA